jgi:phytoene/squalene synthetase
MLDVHGESTSTWAASDALCAGLQINNHLQDCGKDYKDLNRVYLPRDALAAAGATVEALGEGRASAPLLQCLHSLAARTEALLNDSKSLSAQVKDFRLGLEISVIQTFADKIVRLLKRRDPLSETVHLGPMELLAYSLGGVTSEITRRAMGRRPVSKPAAGA